MGDKIIVTVNHGRKADSLTRARVNSGRETEPRPRTNYIAGSNITLGLVDDAVENEIDLTIAAPGHNILSDAHPDTLGATVVAGDIITGNTTPRWSRLARGAVNQVLKAGATLLEWGQVAFAELTGTLSDAQHGTRGPGLHADSHALDHRGRQLLQVGLDAGRPAAGVVGRIYYATDTRLFHYDNGTAWEEYLRAETVSRLASLAERSHASLTGVTADQHHARLHDHSLAADGTPIAVAGVPNLPASRITTERFPMDRIPDGPTGQVLTARGVGVNPVYETVDYPRKLKPAMMRWVRPGWYSIWHANTTMTAGVIYYIPIFVEELTTYIRIGIDVMTAAVGTADLRIFNWSDGVPGSLILSAGTVDTGTIGTREIIISQTLSRGYYFLAIRCSGAPGLRGIHLDTPTTAPVAGIALWLGHPVLERDVILIVTAAYANPAPAPTGTTHAAFATVQLREN